MKTFASAYSGGGGADLGAIAAGLTPIWGIERDSEIAAVYEQNIGRIIVSDMNNVDFSELGRPDVFHASPVCKNFSTAKTGGEESAEDIESANAICRAIRTLLPKAVTIENVYQYRNSVSFAMICRELTDCGYKWDYWHLNSADYGVPQTRKRLILIASTQFQPTKPLETHTEKPIPLFETLLPWVGWYEAIADLIPTLPASKFADWQLARLPQELQSSLLVDSAGFPDKEGVTVAVQRQPGEPTNTVVANYSRREMRAFIINSENQSSLTQRDEMEPSPTIVYGKGTFPPAFIVDGIHGGARDESEPAATVVGDGGSGTVGVKAFLMQVQGEGGDGIRTPDEPMQSVTATHGANKYRAFIVGEQYDQPSGHPDRKPQIAFADEPSMVVRANSNGGTQPRAFLMAGGNQSTRPILDGEPSNTVGNTERVDNIPRAWLDSGRVVRMTPRALARFQSIRDSYILPAKTALACEIIGNAVPPLLAEKIYRHILASLD